ncbi:MAG: Y4bD/Y4pK family protein, partial [Chromatiaceae bacterium]|nr:Y4bD/Y4pK family protein [Chromatiaceae bacterium]
MAHCIAPALWGKNWMLATTSSSERIGASGPRVWTQPSNAPDAKAERRRFRVTHPFHPLRGREYDLIDYRHFWSEDRVV